MSRPIESPRSTSDPLSARPLRVAVLGATGLVGREMTRLLDERGFPVSELRPLASARRGSRTVPFAGGTVPVLPVSRDSLEGVDLVLASAGGDVSREWLPMAAAAGALCVDNTSAFRLDPGVPLVVPEVNAGELALVEPGEGAIVANPNCSTIQLVVALEPLRRAFGLERVQVSTYQSISGAGRHALERFRAASRAILDGEGETVFDGSVPAFDVLACIGEVDQDGHTSEERKMMLETAKILGEDVPMDATCVRVPVFTGHAESVVVQTRESATVAEALEVLRAAPGLTVHTSVEPPTPAAIAGSHGVHVGRLRPSKAFESGLQFWVVADNLLKGAAWNAVQIAELLGGALAPACHSQPDACLSRSSHLQPSRFNNHGKSA